MQENNQNEMQENNGKEKTEGGEIVVKNKFVQWIDNVWYHYKWGIIFAVFFIAVFGICLAQCATAEHPDLIIAYAGHASISDDDAENLTAAEQEEIAKLFASLISKKDDEKETTISFSRFYIYSEEELKELYTDPVTGAELETRGNAQSLNVDQHKSFSNFIISGQSSLWLVSEYAYTTVSPDRLVTLEELGLSPDAYYAHDDYAVRLSSLPIYKNYDVLQNLPEDTLIVLAKSTFAGNSADQEVYSMYCDLLRNIIQYQN